MDAALVRLVRDHRQAVAGGEGEELVDLRPRREVAVGLFGFVRTSARDLGVTARSIASGSQRQLRGSAPGRRRRRPARSGRRRSSTASGRSPRRPARAARGSMRLSACMAPFVTRISRSGSAGAGRLRAIASRSASVAAARRRHRVLVERGRDRVAHVRRQRRGERSLQRQHVPAGERPLGRDRRHLVAPHRTTPPARAPVGAPSAHARSPATQTPATPSASRSGSS